jgi:hypothetical protein
MIGLPQPPVTSIAISARLKCRRHQQQLERHLIGVVAAERVLRDLAQRPMVDDADRVLGQLPLVLLAGHRVVHDDVLARRDHLAVHARLWLRRLP